MARTSQVRLEPDVVANLEGDPELAGLSTSARANRAIRERYADEETAEPAPAAGRATVVSSRRLAASRGRGGCPRCGSRRTVGNRCAACGTTLR